MMERPSIDHSSVEMSVKNILEDVKRNGDDALKRWTEKFDGIILEDLKVSEEEIVHAEKSVSTGLKEAIDIAKTNIEKFHLIQKEATTVIETMPGVKCWRRSVAIEKVGLYIPGGTAPLFSTVLMLGIPAKIAGCKQIIITSPPTSSQQGEGASIHPTILYTASILGIDTIYKIGGAQAIAAMAYGTKSIPPVNKIFGPGNKYVTAAKQLIQLEGIAIDMPAGPTELAIYADETANVRFIAADLLSQAEHGIDSQVLFVTDHAILIDEVIKEIDKQMIRLPRKEIALQALENSKIILVKDEKEAIELLNEYAAEHLILACANADELSELVINAGSVFIGHHSPESAGDYASGTNHTLPTNGFAKAYSGVSVDSFLKKITCQKLTQQGLKNISSTVITMAEAEGLDAHANAVKIRIND